MRIWLSRIPNILLPLFICAIFLDSLRYKFTDAPETQVIFGRLDAWAASWGAAGLFAHTGLFSQYVIGSAELAASGLLLLGFVPGLLISTWLYQNAGEATQLPVMMTVERGVLALGLTVLMCTLSALMAVRKVRALDPAEIF